MTKESFRSKFQTMMTWEGGQRLFNAAYSIGAAIVIWGALFKILHLPGGNTLLCIGMGTEVLMFILTAFDRPPKEYHWEDVFPELDARNADGTPAPLMRGQGGVIVSGGTGGGSGEIIVGGTAAGGAVAPAIPGLSPAQSETLTTSLERMSAVADQLSRMADMAEATERYLSQMTAIADQMEQLHTTTQALNTVSATILDSYRAITENSAAVTENSRGYIAQMADLNRNIGGLNTIYEIQLKSVASQLDAIERVNRGIKDIRDMYEKSASNSARYCEETEKMSRSMQQLNQVYEKMIGAMTVN
ncbi:MAG: gliding motility protein GldL, partial [Duncaniella sp.]|nr:gliding motility protein GldL [Duncaniella sp.]